MISKFNIDLLNRDITVIAELGVNHEGNFDVAKKIIQQLEGSGVAAVKLQSFTPERYISANDAERLGRVKGFCLSLEEHRILKECAHQSGLAFISTPVSEDWVEPLAGICDAIKIASGDIDFIPTITSAAKSNLPVIMSTGTATIDEVDAAVELFKSIRNDKPLENSLSLMHCVSEYPALLSDCNLLSIQFMRDRYGLNVGWSNHVIGKLACHVAVSLGANFIEVHVTDQKDGRSFRDHALSFEPKEMPTLIAELKSIQLSLGKLSKEPTQVEKDNTKMFRKGLIFKSDLKAGHVLVDDDVLFARPALHFSSNQKHRVLGRVLACDVKSGFLITDDDFE